jgi:hypothetical protein
MNIVQIGTNTGNDDLTEIIRSHNIQPELLVLVEPLSIHNKKINDCYSWIHNKIIENIAIRCDNLSEQKFFYCEDDPDYTVASFNAAHIENHGYDKNKINSIIVKCMTINDLFQKYNFKNIDILFIDAEGDDDNILRSIDYNQYNIANIYYENLHLPYPQINTHNFLNDKGYTVTPNVGLNGWSSLAVKNNYVRTK